MLATNQLKIFFCLKKERKSIIWRKEWLFRVRCFWPWQGREWTRKMYNLRGGGMESSKARSSKAGLPSYWLYRSHYPYMPKPGRGLSDLPESFYPCTSFLFVVEHMQTYPSNFSHSKNWLSSSKTLYRFGMELSTKALRSDRIVPV